MTNVSVAVEVLCPLGGLDSGRFLGFLPATARAAQNDTITISNASKVEVANLVDSDDTLETMTYATNVITMTRSDTKPVRGLVVCQI